jgi:hypothetical protein
MPSAETAIKVSEPATAVDDTWGFWGASNKAKKAQSDIKPPPSSPGRKPSAAPAQWGFWGASNKAKKSQNDNIPPPSSPGRETVSAPVDDDYFGFWGASNKLKKSQSDAKPPPSSPCLHPTSMPEDDDRSSWGWGTKSKKSQSNSDTIPAQSIGANPPPISPPPPAEDDIWAAAFANKSKSKYSKRKSNAAAPPSGEEALRPSRSGAKGAEPVQDINGALGTAQPETNLAEPQETVQNDSTRTKQRKSVNHYTPIHKDSAEYRAEAPAYRSYDYTSDSESDHRQRAYSSRRNTSSKVLNTTARRYEPPTYSSDDSYDSRDRTRSRNDKKTTSEKKSDLPVKRSNIAKTFAFGADVFGLDETAKAFRRNAAKYKLEEDRQKDSVSKSRSRYTDLDASRSRSKRYSYLDEPTTRQQRAYESDPNLIPYGADPYTSTTGRDAGLAAAAAAGLYEAKRSRSKRDGKGDEGVERERRRYYV